MHSPSDDPIPPVSCAKDYRYDDSVGYLIKRVRSMLACAIDREMVDYDVSHEQWSILLTIANGRGDTAADLSREVSCDTSSMTRMIDRLEAKGLVKRHRSEADRRVVRIAITEAGQAIADRMPELMVRVMNRHLKGFSPAEVQLLKSLLRRMLENAEDANLKHRLAATSAPSNQATRPGT